MPLDREGADDDVRRRFAEALAAHQRGARPAAEDGYREVLEHRTDFADAWNNLGVLLNEGGRHAEALACFRRLAELEPAKPRSHANLGVALRALGRSDDAKASYREAVRLDPGFHSAQNNLGNLHYAAGEFAAALHCFDAAAKLMPAMPEYRFMMAKSLVECRRLDRAEAELRFVIQCDPAHADAWGILGRVWSERHCLKEALDCFDRGLAVRPAYDGLRYNRGLARLLDGDLAGGFADYERRFEVKDFPSKRLATAQPLWDGRELPEETLLLHAEQGLGDTLQFLRYLPAVARRAKRVLLLIQETLTPLAVLPANVELLHEGEKMPPFDWVCPLLSLPNLFATTLATIPGNLPYLRTDAPSAVDWAARIAGRGLRVGLVWAGNPSHQNDANRSLALAGLQPLFEIPGINYYSLQVGERRQDIAGCGLGERLPDLGSACGSFADTAAALRELDLLICVDTSIAHLAGGLGLPVWLLLPWMPDWRWLLEREDSPWYSSLRLFRQTAAGDWEGVVERLGQALAALAKPASAAGQASLRAAQLLVEEGREELERSGAALAAPLFWRALREHPRLARAASALAVLAYRAGKAPAAVQFGRRACRQEPDDAENWSNCGAYFKAAGQVDRALACFEHGLAANPDYPGLTYNRGLARLLAGDMAGGFADYERRFEVKDFPSKRLATVQPLWDGREVPEATLLLHAEQGLGDTLQFLRYLPEVARRAKRVLLLIQETLTPLAQLPANVELLHEGEKMPAFDQVCPLLSLPHLFGTTLAMIPGNLPYLRPDAPSAVDWTARITGRGLRVGLVWAGNPSHQNDANRSLALAGLQPLFEIPGIDYYSLQVGDRRQDITGCGLGERLPDLGGACGSFADTAAALRELDLLICVDTSIAHLAGGLGLPVWLLLPWMPDWRWLLEREDSPWYPSLRLFRQTAAGDWEGVVERLGQALAALAEPASAAGQASLRAALLLVEEGREELERSGAALAAPLFWRALREHPRLARAASALAVLAYRAGKAPAAVQFGRRACRHEPGDAENWSNCGAFLKAVGRLDEALACQRQALMLAPESAAVHANLGNILGALGDWDGAEQAARTAIALAPESPEFLFGLGVALREQADFAAALAVFRQTQRLAGGHVKAALHEALIELLTGDLSAGWEHYESRWLQPDCKEKRTFNRPCWRGEPLAGKRILLHAEQGFGDSFQFLRYVPLVAALGAQVILVVQPELESLAARLDGSPTLIRSGEPLPDFDYHCPLLSLPRAFATELASVPAAVPYLAPLPERLAVWEARLPKRRGYRIGLVWAGRPSHGNDANRSMRLAMFDELLAIPGSEWFSLQKGPAAGQLAGASGGIADLGGELDSFEDTAAVLAQLDELVTVDTSVAHLAGALGLPVRILLPQVPDWRWLWERKDSPWYPSARLYRQTTRGDWSAPLAELAADLRLAAQK